MKFKELGLPICYDLKSMHNYIKQYKNMSKLKQNKIPVQIDEKKLIQIAVDQGALENEFNWKLVREGDTLTAKSKEVMWLEWSETGRFKDKHEEPALGRSLLMSPFTRYFTWQTTKIITFKPIENGFIFSTINSNYTLTKIYECIGDGKEFK